MAAQEPEDIVSAFASIIRIQGFLLVAIGLLIGIFADRTTYPLEILIGLALVAGGAVRLIGNLRHPSGLLAVAGAGAGLVVGMLLLFHPRAAALDITIVLACLFFIEGLMALCTAIVIRRPFGRGLWLSAIFNLVLALLLWRDWPSDAGWVVGLFVGISLALHGVALLAGATIWRRFAAFRAAPAD